MSLFFETIRIENGNIYNLHRHNLRFNRTRKHFFPDAEALRLESYIRPPSSKGLWRCRILYGRNIEKVEYLPYSPRRISSFKLIEADIQYHYKYADREEIDRLFGQKGRCDEILIVDEEGYLRDTSIANIALYDGLRWITPRRPLLEGTMRARLCERELLLEKDVKIKDLKEAVGFAVINAMVGFRRIDRPRFEIKGEWIC